jgi:[ribosomal protein S5]-alanine N-acetyltransferase
VLCVFVGYCLNETAALPKIRYIFIPTFFFMLLVNFTPFPVLSTERLLLRAIHPEDDQQLFSIRSDKRVMKFLDRPLAASIDEVREFIGRIITDVSNNNGITWAISVKDEPELIGTIGYWKLDKHNYRAEIGYMIHADWAGKGLMQEAMTAVIDYGFSEMKLHSIEANVNPANEASIKLLERNKFVQEAYFKENYYYDGRFLDSVIYSLLTPG